MHKSNIWTPRNVCASGFFQFGDFGFQQAAAAAAGGGGGGGGFTAFTEGFANLAAWTTVGTIAAVGGRLRISATTASAYVTDLEMTEAEGSKDISFKYYYSGTHEGQLGFLMDATMAAVTDYYRGGVGNGYVAKITGGEISVYSVASGVASSALKSWNPTVNSGDTLAIRPDFAANGDLTLTALQNGSAITGGTLVIAAASLVAGRGVLLGLCGFANAGNTTEFDDFSYDVTAA